MNAERDENNVPTLIAVSNANGTTINRVEVTSGHRLHVSDGSTGTDHGTPNANRDENNVPCLMGVSSINHTDGNGYVYVQGVTPVAVYTDGSGALLIQST
jgi:hypothetical protein